MLSGSQPERGGPAGLWGPGSSRGPWASSNDPPQHAKEQPDLYNLYCTFLVAGHSKPELGGGPKHYPQALCWPWACYQPGLALSWSMGGARSLLTKGAAEPHSPVCRRGGEPRHGGEDSQPG